MTYQGVRDMNPNEQREHLSELIRLAEMAWIEQEHDASCREEGRKIVLAQMINELLAKKLEKSAVGAERTARTSRQFAEYLRAMHDSRRKANELRAAWKKQERTYWGLASHEATERRQMQMAGR